MKAIKIFSRSIGFFFLSLLLSYSLFAIEKAQVRSVTPKQFTDKEKGFSITFPKFWQINENVKGAAVMGFSPKENEADTFLENVNVVASQANLEGYDAQKYFQVNYAPLAELEGFKEVERGETTLEGKKAIWVIFTHQTGNLDAKAIQYYLVRGSRGYVITGTGLSTTFEKYKPQFDQVARSFKSL